MPKSKAQPKKEQPKQTNSNHIIWIIGIVAIVAIIAIVFVNTRQRPITTDDSSVAGQAINFRQLQRVGGNTGLTFLGLETIQNKYLQQGINFAQDKTGDQICTDMGYSRCIATQLYRSIQYYPSTNGSCSGQFQQTETYYRLGNCNIQTHAGMNCGTNDNYIEPAHGDFGVFDNYIDGVLCQ